MIRMKLSGLTNIDSLDFDIPNRMLTVYHSEGYATVLEKLDSLNFNTVLIESTPAGQRFSDVDRHREKKLLWMVLGINLLFFALEMIAGFMRCTTFCSDTRQTICGLRHCSAVQCYCEKKCFNLLFHRLAGKGAVVWFEWQI